MRRTILVAACMLMTGFHAAYADLQNVEVGGDVRVRGRYWRNTYENAIAGPAVVRIPANLLPGRPLGPFGTASRYDWDDRGNDLDFVEQRTRLRVLADFTNHVAGFVELESYDLWGTDFRSDYVTGVDRPAVIANDIELYQAYIQAGELYGTPLRLRIGRQEMEMGKGWLVDDIAAAIFGLSFDAVRLTYATDAFTLDAWASKLAERAALEQDGDVDFYGVYGTYTAFDPLHVSLYYYLVRDARALADTNLPWFGEWLENLLGLDDYDPTYLNTVGTRLFGASGGFDYDLELAYQFGDADAVGSLFIPYTYGDTRAEFGNWGGDLELGYTFDLAWRPRVSVGGAYFEGEDRRGLSFWEWLSPFERHRASVSFNRLFAGTPYSAIMEIGQDMTNFHQVRASVRAQPTEAVTASLTVAYYGVNDPFDLPVSVRLGRYRVPLAPNWSFWTRQADDDIGFTTHLWAQYQYSEALFFRVGWEHLFTGDGLREGSFLHRNGLQFSGGTDDDDADYFYFDTGLRF